MFCREQVAQLAEWNGRFVAAGAQIVIIGNGGPEAARAFAEERKLPFRLLTDPSLRTYDAAGAKRTLTGGLNPSVALRAVETYQRGHRQGASQGSLFQNGAGFLVLPGGAIPWCLVSKEAGDHFDPAAPLAALSGPGAAARTA